MCGVDNLVIGMLSSMRRSPRGRFTGTAFRIEQLRFKPTRWLPHRKHCYKRKRTPRSAGSYRVLWRFAKVDAAGKEFARLKPLERQWDSRGPSKRRRNEQIRHGYDRLR